MKPQHYFDLKRFWLLFKLELSRNSKGIAMVFVITFGMLFFIGFLLSLMVEGNVKTFQHHSNYASSLLLGGFILSSLAFNDLGDPIKRHMYFTLPVSTLEKWLSMWLLTSFGWMLLFTIAYTCYTFLANPLGQFFFKDVTFETFNPVDDFAISVMKYYFVFQGVFLVGAAHFRGYAFVKTMFVLVVVSLVSVTMMYFTLKDVFQYEHDCTGYDCELLPQIGKHTAWQTLRIFFWWIFAPLCWVLSYLGLKEQEV